MLDIPEFDMLSAHELKEINEACQRFDSQWNGEAMEGRSPSLIDNLSTFLDSSMAVKAEFRRAACHACFYLDIGQSRKRG